MVVTLLMSVSMARSITANFSHATRGFGAIGARRSYSRSTITMGFCHYYKYKPEGYPDLEERKKLFTRVSDEAALLYTKMPEIEMGPNRRGPYWEKFIAPPGETPEAAEERRLKWLRPCHVKESPTFTSEAVLFGYFRIFRDGYPEGKDPGFIKVGPASCRAAEPPSRLFWPFLHSLSAHLVPYPPRASFKDWPHKQLRHACLLDAHQLPPAHATGLQLRLLR